MGWAGQDGLGESGADRAELAAVADALIGYYLAGRRTEDALLGEALAVWAEWEELHEQALQRVAGRGLLHGRRGPRVLAGDEQAVMQRYLGAWRRWLDRQTQYGGRSGGR